MKRSFANLFIFIFLFTIVANGLYAQRSGSTSAPTFAALREAMATKPLSAYPPSRLMAAAAILIRATKIIHSRQTNKQITI